MGAEGDHLWDPGLGIGGLAWNWMAPPKYYRTARIRIYTGLVPRLDRTASGKQPEGWSYHLPDPS